MTLFTHIPQTTNATNQLASLAGEVNDAFLTVEDLLQQDDSINSSINSSIGSLDNWYVREYLPEQKLILDYVQTLVFPDNSQEASLDLFPARITDNTSPVSINNITDPSQIYTYKESGHLTAQNDFTFVGRKIVFGGPQFNTTNQSITYQLNISYEGYNPTDNNTNEENVEFDLRYNVLMVKDISGNKVTSFPVSQSGTTYTVSGHDYRSLCSPFIQNIIDNSPTDLLKYGAIFTEDSGEVIKVNITSLTISNTAVTFVTDDVINTGNPVKIYVSNASLGKLIEGLYRLFYAHNHGSNGGELISHKDLTGLYENTYDETSGNPIIEYYNSELKNYDHPQYLNRSGYIANQDIYNNAMIGDLLMASTDPTLRYNNVNNDSRAIVFGNYGSGHTMKYSFTDDALVINAISKNGLKLSMQKNKKSLSINNHTFSDMQTSDVVPLNYLQLSLESSVVDAGTGREQGIFKFLRKDLVDGDVDEAKIYSNEAEFSKAVIDHELNIKDGSTISFGTVPSLEISKEDDGLHFKSTNEDEDAVVLGNEVFFDIPVTAVKETVTDLFATNSHITQTKQLVFHPDATDTTQPYTYTQFINYDTDDNCINVNSPKYVNFALNGYRSGISYDKRMFAYASADTGAYSPIQGSQANLFIESQESVYFLLPTDDAANNLLNPTSAFRPSVDDLTTFARSDIYTGITNANTINLTSGSLDGSQASVKFDFGSDSMFSGKDASGNIVTFLSSNNIIAANNYIYNSSTQKGGFQYSQFSANKFFSQPNGTQLDDPANGFYGNIFVGNGQSLNITTGGIANFGVPVTFNQTVTFNGLVQASNIVADNVTVNQTLTVDAMVTGNGGNPGNISLTSGHIFQQDSAEVNTFMGEVDIFNDLQVKNNGSINMNGGIITGITNTSPTPGPTEAIPYSLLSQTLADLSGIHATMIANGLSSDLVVPATHLMSTDLDGVIGVGEYWIGFGCTNTPFGTLYSTMKVWRANSANVAQIVQNLGTNRVYIRTLPGNGIWGAWQALAYKSEIDYLQSEIDALNAGIYNGQVYATGTNGQSIAYTVPVGKTFRIVGCGGGGGGGGVALHINSNFPGYPGTSSTASLNGSLCAEGGGGGRGEGSTYGNRTNTYFGRGAGGVATFNALGLVGSVSTILAPGEPGYGLGPIGGGGSVTTGNAGASSALPIAALGRTYFPAVGWGLGSSANPGGGQGSTAGGGGAGGSFDLMLKNVSGAPITLQMTAGTKGAPFPGVANVYAGHGDDTPGFVAILI